MSVEIRGQGVAASICAHLLRRRGASVAMRPTGRASVPAILVSHSTARLFEEVLDRPQFFSAAHPVRRRVVLWGKDSEPVSMDHAGCALPEQALIDAIGGTAFDGVQGNPEWTVYASKPLPDTAASHAFGSRRAAIAQVRLSGDADACWVEAVERGWLFLIPTSAEAGYLIAVGAPMREQLEASRLVRGQVAEVLDIEGEFPVSPRISDPLSGHRWLACGAAAMSFDPICGDGTGNAVREAILAGAAIGAIADGEDPVAVMAHYETRLKAGFCKHLALSKEFYSTGYGGTWWDEQVNALEEGMQRCAASMPTSPPRYALRGFDLVKI